MCLLYCLNEDNQSIHVLLGIKGDYFLFSKVQYQIIIKVICLLLQNKTSNVTRWKQGGGIIAKYVRDADAILIKSNISSLYWWSCKF